ncbi:hypothetical protein [Paraburkholderia tagetis]|uniref:Uncharacterized protein n=1 Tax=Paraburkholderia tagetis TaxID=2913261 RepID=A0A9X1RKB9_9BURK|nr:hypothetical protein [Paraburkholderia tagetis]MCG5072705.1 hypothetical protein [Paraburkholderia tagetis]
MTRIYEYEGFRLEISIESDFNVYPSRRERTPGYIAIVNIFQADYAVALFSPLRFCDADGRPFVAEAAALMGGYGAARKLVDDLFFHDRP